MKIGIIGAGHIGSVLARMGTKHGHEVMISNSRGPDTLMDLAKKIGCEAGTSVEAGEFGDLVVATIPLKDYKSIPVEPLAGKVVIDTMNYYQERDGNIAVLDSRQTTTSELVAAHLLRSRIVKAFNAIIAKDIEADAKPQGAVRRALPIAGDNEEANKVVAKLLDQFGFEAVDTGPLVNSWRFERDKPAYCVPLGKIGLLDALQAAERDVEVP